MSDKPDSNKIEKPSFDGVIFLPGLLCDERLFAPQVKALEGQYAIEIPDLGAWSTFEDMSAAVLGNTRFQRFALAGLSMGGALALNMARWAPDRIERLAILDSNPGPDDSARKSNRRRQIVDAESRGVAELTRSELAGLYLAPQNQTPQLVELAVSMAERHGLDVYKRQQNALMSRQSSRPYLAQIQVPALVLCGQEDKLCLPQWHDEMAKEIPNSQLVKIPGAGHLSTLEAPGDVNAALSNWLSHRQS
ncbi:MAG: alpha/beta fold hydrolase [Rhizobiaceae bacterium]